ncbi:hypothetical protein ACF059_28950 [Streptomyces sp. NPDC016562]|uniref:hypothetical protein n=1 Tax=Streptomyces sp. NPDC016562 TaxID=3364966 RepID=UPI0036F741B7
MSEVQKVAARQAGWAVAAVAVAAVVTLIGIVMFTAVAGYFMLTAMAVVTPLQLREHPKAFARVCAFLSAGLLAWAVVGLVIGMFLFLPTAVLLLFAALADADNRPGGWWAASAPLAAAAAMALPSVMPPDTGNGPPPSFHANLDSTSRFHDPDFNKKKARLKEFGATSVSVGEWAGRLELTVEVPEGFHEESRARLEERIRQLPGVVDLCFDTYDTCQKELQG